MTIRILSLLTLIATSVPGLSSDYFVYFGTYTRPEKSEGIYRSEFSADGKLSDPDLVAELKNPSFLAISPNEKSLYAVSEGDGVTTAFSIDSETGNLTPLNALPTKGSPCHVTLDPKGKTVLVANYGGGSVISYPVNDDGSLGRGGSFIEHEGSSIDPKRQASPHAHSIYPFGEGKFACAADLGTDSVFIYKLDSARGTLEPAAEVKLKPGSGPRYLDFHPDGKHVYVLGEMTRDVHVFDMGPDLTQWQPFQIVSTLPGDAPAQGSTAEIRVHPNGKFLYASNRGHDSIAVFSINESGRLRRVENEPIQGKTPRNFNLDPEGKFLLAAGQNSDSVAVFRIDEKTGELEFTGESITLGNPVCIQFLRK